MADRDAFEELQLLHMLDVWNTIGLYHTIEGHKMDGYNIGKYLIYSLRSNDDGDDDEYVIKQFDVNLTKSKGTKE